MSMRSLLVHGRKSLAERCLLRGANGMCSTVDDVDLGVDQLRRMLRELVGWQPKILAIDLQVLTLDKTEPAQPVI